MGTIVAIGGGEIEDRDTLPIDTEIVALSRTPAPTALFLPTASGDAEGYIETFHEVYGEELGCETRVMKLVERNLSEKEIEENIDSADLIYVGGGNTRKMMEVWRDAGVDKLLREAYDDGTVLSGLSAGAICWFEAGHSDSESFETDEGGWDYVRVDGLDLVEDVIFCPHYHSEERVEPFQKFMRDYPGKTGLAVDDGCALTITDDRFQVLSPEDGGDAYRVECKDGEVTERRIDKGTLDSLRS